jgi:hypothetical protein
MPDPRNHLEDWVTCYDASVFTVPRDLEGREADQTAFDRKWLWP